MTVRLKPRAEAPERIRDEAWRDFLASHVRDMAPSVAFNTALWWAFLAGFDAARRTPEQLSQKLG